MTACQRIGRGECEEGDKETKVHDKKERLGNSRIQFPPGSKLEKDDHTDSCTRRGMKPFERPRTMRHMRVCCHTKALWIVDVVVCLL